jgi:glutaredoxin-dependent peroxiredoxin
MKLEAGQAAPLFKLYNTEKQEISLEQFRGSKVILMFFPAAFTSVCTTQMCTMDNELEWYNDVNAVVLGISTDTLFTLDRYKKEHNIKFDLLSDFNKEVCGEYGAQYDMFKFNMKGVARRAAFVINEEGVVTYAEVLENAGDLPDFDKVKAALS